MKTNRVQQTLIITSLSV